MERLTAFDISDALKDTTGVGWVAEFQPRAIRTAVSKLLAAGASWCGHPGPWLAKPDDGRIRCPICMATGDVYDRWLGETKCTSCGEDAPDALLWLAAFDKYALLAIRLCAVCAVDVVEVNLETEIRK